MSRPFKSGFCNASNPPESHHRCSGAYHGHDCTCTCHTKASAMTLRTYDHLEQGSDAWFAARRGMVTASVVGSLVTPTRKVADNDTSRGLTALLVAERITGYSEPTYMNDDMLRGVMDEPLARDLYSEKYAPVTEAGFLVREFDGFEIGYSPDGLVGDDGLIEVKSRRQKKHLQTILFGEVPPENMAQLQTGLLVSGRKWIDYLSYCGGMPMWRKRVEPDPEWFAVILDAVRLFEKRAEVWVSDYRKAIKGLPRTERVGDLELVI